MNYFKECCILPPKTEFICYRDPKGIVKHQQQILDADEAPKCLLGARYQIIQ
jgi:hypothetical protein